MTEKDQTPDIRIKLLEEKQMLSRGFQENGGFLYLLGACYPKGFITKANIFAYYFLLLSHIPCLINTVLVTPDDLGLRYESAHWAMLMTETMLASLIAVRHKDRFDRIFTIMGGKFHDYGSTLDDATKRNIELLTAESKKQINFIFRAFIIAVASTGGILTIARSAYEVVLGRFQEPQKENGIVTCIPASMWYPFDLVGGYKAILVTIEYYAILVTAFLVLALDLGFATQAHAVCSQFKVLALTLRNFEQRAEYLFFRRYSSQFKGNSDNYRKTPFFHACIQACIIESVKHHQLLIRFCRHLYTYSYVLVMSIVYSSTLLICLSAYVFNADVSLAVKLTFFCFLTTELVQCYVYCWYCQKILDCHDKIALSTYFSNWTAYSEVVRPYFLIIQARCNVNLEISSGGIQIMSLNVFIQVVRSAFSFYSVLQTNAFKSTTHPK